MGKKNDGGPAFPWTDPYGTEGLPQQSAGMTLRDYFAAKAMQAFLDSARATREPFGKVSAAVAIISYGVADAMLAEREK